MALVASFEEMKAKQIRLDGDPKRGTNGAMLATDFFEFPDKPDLPHATLFHFDPGRVSHPHFHMVDQFQVVVGGKAKLGRRDVAAYGVHFSRGYTPYGPFVSDPVEGLACFVMHANARIDWRSRHLPAKQDELKREANRQPWQITFQVNFPELQSDTSLRLIPDLEGENRLAAYTLSMKPNTMAPAPDPSTGEGQYVVVVTGSLLHDGREHQSLALVFVGPHEGPFQIHAGSQGLEAIVLNYPRADAHPDLSRRTQAAAGVETWQCMQCAFAYDAAAGYPADGIAPGTRWRDVPETWTCPDCGASKADFAKLGPGVRGN